MMPEDSMAPADRAAPAAPEDSASAREGHRRRVVLVTVFLLVCVAARVFSLIARRLTFQVEPGPSPAIRFPEAGPYNERLGYSRLPVFLERLAPEYEVSAQARSSELQLVLVDRGLFPIYREKTQAGLRILDRTGADLFSAPQPRKVYETFDAIPPLVVRTLLYIENRELIDAHPTRNPAVEWDRLARALLAKGMQPFRPDRRVPGGSTLATQLEKLRHSPEGRTTSAGEKIRQMLSASLRAYQEGENTLDARRRIVVDYLNTLPLAALPDTGEIYGLGDGLAAWFRADREQVDRLLAAEEHPPDADNPQARALAFKQVLALCVAQRRPSYYLIKDRAGLEELTNSYLRLAAAEGIITQELRDLALALPLWLRDPGPAGSSARWVAQKATQTIRARLVHTLGLERVYELDRLDFTVGTTLDAPAQATSIATLRGLLDPARAQAAGLRQPRMLDRGDPSRVVYSLALFEHVDDVNLLRVDADTFEQPLNINEGAKLELGSTAKLRTLVTYLEIVAALHERHAGSAPEELTRVEVARSDRLTRWALDYLARAGDRSLSAMLEAAMNRTYSASPHEAFFTGGGRHEFHNFDPKDDDRVMTVRAGFAGSVNLVFIRLMRDVVNYCMFRVPGSSARVLEDADDPLRQVLLRRFADREGQQFLRRFWREYGGGTPDEALEALLADVRATPKRLAAIFRSVRPSAPVEELEAFLRARLPGSALSDTTARKLYEDYGPERFDLADRGYHAGLHPLELWLVGYRYERPEATLAQALADSEEQRQQVYQWLFKAHRKHAQDIRIRTLLEVEAFLEIHRAWKRLGYPFDSLVPSYATAIGSSGDRPAALAELVGILQAGGVRSPILRIRDLRFAERTPYETHLRRKTPPGEHVLRPEIAAVVRQELVGVVERGTARRVRGAVVLPDGREVTIGGKTGTGDNRHDVYGARGQLLESRPVNRTATFVFLLGERHFGTVTAYVAGPESDDYKFTSSLALAVFKELAPVLAKLVEPPAPLPPAMELRAATDGEGAAEAAAARQAR
jgi:membrane peptidoglycan carboxypeptidase